jgi:hypothetical protein
MPGLKASLKNERSPSGGQFTDAILHFYKNPKKRLLQGEFEHRLFEHHFKSQGILNRYLEPIQNVSNYPEKPT